MGLHVPWVKLRKSRIIFQRTQCKGVAASTCLLTGACKKICIGRSLCESKIGHLGSRAPSRLSAHIRKKQVEVQGQKSRLECPVLGQARRGARFRHIFLKDSCLLQRRNLDGQPCKLIVSKLKRFHHKAPAFGALLWVGARLCDKRENTQVVRRITG